MTTDAIAARLKESEDLLHWIHEHLHELTVPRLPEKRVHLACGAWHVGIEYHQAIVTLVHDGLLAAAMALVRPMLEAFVRGMWLAYAATDAEVDRAGEDHFPNNVDKLIGDLKKAEQVPHEELAVLKSQWWKRLCSYTHTGYQQIGARLTMGGIGYDYSDAEMVEPLMWADWVALLITSAFAKVAENRSLDQALNDLVQAKAAELDEGNDEPPPT
jgi:hypothetical protein